MFIEMHNPRTLTALRNRRSQDDRRHHCQISSDCGIETSGELVCSNIFDDFVESNQESVTVRTVLRLSTKRHGGGHGMQWRCPQSITPHSTKTVHESCCHRVGTKGWNGREICRSLLTNYRR